MAFKTIIFSLITLMCSISFGQVPVTKDRLLILVTGKTTCSLSKDADRHFNDASVRQYMKDQGIQFVRIYGSDTDAEWRTQNKVTHYPAVVYYMKQDGELKWVKTYSGVEKSRLVGKASGVRSLLGMKAETYRQNTPSNHPLIPGSNSQPPTQYIRQPQPQLQPPTILWQPQAPLMPSVGGS